MSQCDRMKPMRPNENVAHPPVPRENNVPQPPNTNHAEVHGMNTPPPTFNERTTPASVPHTPPPAAQSEANRGGPPRPNRPPLVAKTPPPPEKLPYAQKAPAMEQLPGRPLEPQQKENLNAGKPPGPMMDKEFPPHAEPAPRAAPPPRSAPKQHGEPSKH